MELSKAPRDFSWDFVKPDLGSGYERTIFCDGQRIGSVVGNIIFPRAFGGFAIVQVQGIANLIPVRDHGQWLRCYHRQQRFLWRLD